ncbi:MAG: sigma-70 family RNA polymerase sigma factor [Planctomycetota bacterium]
MDQTPVDEDLRLVEATLAGDRDAFAELVERHSPRLFGVVRGYTRIHAEVEDVVQETFLKAFSKLDTFKGEALFSTWLLRIAVNTARDLLKRRGRSPVSAVEDPEVVTGAEVELHAAIQAPSVQIERHEIARITEEVLDELPEVFRTVLVMREFEEQSYQDIADTLGVSIGTIESRLFRARARFKEALLRLHPEVAGELGADWDGPRKRRRMKRSDEGRADGGTKGRGEGSGGRS